MDWGVGRYERAAEQLFPAARAVVDSAAPVVGEHVVDLGSGTGNAALLAAARGARVTGVDPARRLLEVASERAAAAGLEARFVEGEAAAIPLEDTDADVLLSVFGVVFAPDVEAAAGEMSRVLGAPGRMVLSAWIPGGAISDMARIAREAITRAAGRPPGPPPFAWHDEDALAALLRPHGFEVATVTRRLAFTAASPGDFLAGEWADHPLWVAGRALLEPRNEVELLRERVLEILEAGNEDPDAFRVTSRYVIATARRA